MQFTKETRLGETKFSVSADRNWNSATFPPLTLDGINIRYKSVPQWSEGCVRMETESVVVIIDRFDCHASPTCYIHRPKTGGAPMNRIGSFGISREEYEDIRAVVSGGFHRHSSAESFSEAFTEFCGRYEYAVEMLTTIMNEAEIYYKSFAIAEVEKNEAIKAMF